MCLTLFDPQNPDIHDEEEEESMVGGMPGSPMRM